MKVLLDENLPHDLRHQLAGHDVFTVAYMGWSSLENGELLKAAGDARFDVMVTKDSGVQYEQNLDHLPVAVVVLKARTNKIDDIQPLVPQVLAALTTLKPKTVVRVG